MKRIVIIGCPGSGKSYLSRELAAKTGLPIIHLDYYFHQTGKDYLNDEKAWRKKVQALSSDETWIMEGNYKRTTFDIRLPLADTIIHLDYPSRITTWRVLKRRVLFRNKKRPEMPEDWKEKIDPGFFRYVVRYRKTDRPDVMRRLSAYLNVITLKSPKATRAYLKNIK